MSAGPTRARRTELKVSVRVDEAAAPTDAWGTLQEIETAKPPAVPGES